ncbi:MAG: adenosylmethionine decarboxylase [Calothrix sp. C42_A2020_038]|nr:adenosylmethionine decarboxylase [Calothrix sp. C42_A2020_038]
MEDLRYEIGGGTVNELKVDGVDTSFMNGLGICSTISTADRISSLEESKETLADFTTSSPQELEVPVGVHCILELYNCPMDLLNDIEFIKQTLEEAAKTARSTLLHRIAHQFHPQGVTALALLAESHISIHTWPENGYLAADVFTCGEHAKPVEACQYIARAFKSGKHLLMKLPRGRFSPSVQPHIEVV